MMDFPNAPTNGQKYPVTPVAGQTQYTWDGEKWTTMGGSGGLDQATADARFVNVSGDTMTGNLTVQGNIFAAMGATSGYVQFGTSGTKFLNYDGTNFLLTGGQLRASNEIFSGFSGTTGGYYFGNTGTKYLNYDGTNFNFAGGAVVAPSISANGNITAVGVFTSMPSASTGTYQFGNTGTKYLNYDGTNFNLTGGNLIHYGELTVGAASANVGIYRFGNNGTKYLQCDGTQFNLVGGVLAVSANIVTNSTSSIQSGGDVYVGNNLPSNATIRFNSGAAYINWNGTVLVSNVSFQVPGHICRAGTSGGYSGNQFNMFYTGGVMQLWVDATNLGNVAISSDYRIKKDVLDLPGMWDTVKALRPIKYTQAQFSPPSHVKYIAEETLKARKEAEENPEAKPREVNTAPLIPADDIERWGFIAHELQATLIPSASTGVKDAPDTIQSPNPFTLIAALTKALQEAMARIEALEAR